MFYTIGFLRLNVLSNKNLTHASEQLHAVSGFEQLFTKVLASREGKLGGESKEMI